ncbi:MAG: hypothetical protein F4051_14600 [Boseongicola sp. SB0670_bin_30]|nr:hypothetical protein [Boseongicola sp. SB0670_bin_30]
MAKSRSAHKSENRVAMLSRRGAPFYLLRKREPRTTGARTALEPSARGPEAEHVAHETGMPKIRRFGSPETAAANVQGPQGFIAKTDRAAGFVGWQKLGASPPDEETLDAEVARMSCTGGFA